jgi:hypothetical protein
MVLADIVPQWVIDMWEEAHQDEVFDKLFFDVMAKGSGFVRAVYSPNTGGVTLTNVAHPYTELYGLDHVSDYLIGEDLDDDTLEEIEVDLEQVTEQEYIDAIPRPDVGAPGGAS